MSARTTSGIVLLITAAWLGLPPARAADELKKKDQPSLNDLSMEISALQSLYSLRLTDVQLAKLRELAKQTADKPAARQSAKATEKYYKLLQDLRAALVQNKDDQHIDDLNQQLDKLTESEKPELDDSVDITDEAREQAPKALRLLQPSQVAAYLGGFADTIGDPLEKVLDGLTRVRDMEDKEWESFRTTLPDEVGRLVAGLDSEKAARIGDQLVELLIVVRGLKDDEFKKQRPELDKKAREIVGDLGPTDVLRNVMEYHLAELLSNPWLVPAIDARLK